MDYKFIVSSSPHIHQNERISNIMLDVIIALMPATFMGVYIFGLKALMVLVTAVAACVISEYLYEYFMKKQNTVSDLSAVVTGLLLGLNLPSTIPLWMVVVGSVFAIIIVKQLFGGLGKNFINPALCARCFMLVAWAEAMATFSEPFTSSDVISSATPLAVMSGTSQGGVPTLLESLVGITPGCIGETSAAMLIIGGLYLIVRKVITWKIPVFYILTFFVFEFLFGKNPLGIETFEYTLIQTMSGGLLIAAFFMATDYVTTPTTKSGQIIFGFGCGLLTFLIRNFGAYPEGASFSIILMNLLTPLIDRYTIPKKFGFVKVKK